MFYLWKSDTADGDCSHEIKRRLLLGRKVMTNLESILKSRDITLPTKVRLVKAVVFPVVMYGCESWTVKIKWPEGLGQFLTTDLVKEVTEEESSCMFTKAGETSNMCQRGSVLLFLQKDPKESSGRDNDCLGKS